MKPNSQNARLLNVLRGGPASNARIHREAGDMIVNSRVAELRKLGYEIDCEHVGGTGADAFVYTLLSEPAEKTLEREQSSESTLAGARPDAGSESSDLTTGGGIPQPALARPSQSRGDLTAPSRLGLGSPSPSPTLPPVSPATAVPQLLAVAGVQLDLFGAAA